MSQAISKNSGYESINASLSGMSDQYEAFSRNGLGDDINSITFATDGGYVLAQGTPTIYPSDPSAYPMPTAQASSGFNWSSLFGNLINVGAQTGLQIAKNVSNPAYTTPGAFTRLADGTIITTAGNPVTGYSIPTSSLLSTGISSISPLLLIGGVVVVALMLGRK